MIFLCKQKNPAKRRELSSMVSGRKVRRALAWIPTGHTGVDSPRDQGRRSDQCTQPTSQRTASKAMPLMGFSSLHQRRVDALRSLLGPGKRTGSRGSSRLRGCPHKPMPVRTQESFDAGCLCTRPPAGWRSNNSPKKLGPGEGWVLLKSKLALHGLRLVRNSKL